MHVKSKTIFLIDALGALLSSTFACIIYFFFQNQTGFTPLVLNVMIFVPAVYFFVSMFSHINAGKKWKTMLKLIIGLNLFYCIITVCFIISFWDVFTAIGKLYLSLELIIILFLVKLEHTLLQQSRATF